jgi:ribonuclease PH
MRSDGRAPGAMRPVSIERHFTRYAEGSVLACFGETRVLCTATVEHRVPPFLKDSGSGWVTAEYAMLPRSTSSRVNRDSVNKGRAQEISRLIGRSLRNVVDLGALGERQILIDCDVLQADGGTRTAAITGSWVALHDAIAGLLASGDLTASPLLAKCAGVSVGVVEGEVLTDLCQEEDVRADVDLNLVMRDDGNLIEVQGTAEGEAFPFETLHRMLAMGADAARILFAAQEDALRDA